MVISRKRLPYIIIACVIASLLLTMIIRAKGNNTKCGVEMLDKAMEAENYEAIQYCAHDGFPRAMAFLGRLYIQGKGVAQDYKKSMEWSLKAAKQNDVVAMNVIGSLYNNGLGVPENDDTAIAWYKKAADLGSADDMYDISVVYANKSFSSVEDEDNARLSHEWRYKAVNSGSIKAIMSIGIDYEHGRRCAQDYVQAMKWYQKAASMGYPQAFVHIGNLYANGFDVEQDYEKAKEWYQKAADKGDNEAQILIQPNPAPFGLELTKATVNDFKNRFPKHMKIDYLNKYNNGSMYFIEGKYAELDGVVGKIMFVFNKRNFLEAVRVYFVRDQFSKLQKVLDNKYTAYSTRTYQSGNSYITLKDQYTSFSWRDLDTEELITRISIGDYTTLIYNTIPFDKLIRKENDRLNALECKIERSKEKAVKDVL
jgi:hypothetical protein